MTDEENIKITNLSTLEKFLLLKDNSKNSLYMSDIPTVCKDYPCVLGIDEAGRGPVLGPMVYGTAFCPINNMVILDEIGCMDSKVLNEEKRDEIFNKICELSKTIGWGVEVIAPNSICNSMLSRSKYSLNQVSMDAAIKLIKSAKDAGVNIAHIYVDTVGPPDKYQAYLSGLFPKYKITVEKKADSTYSVVSAASICAKVTRDHSLKVWDFQEDIDMGCEKFGSGYPGDPNTKNFLINFCEPVFGFPQIVRFSWSTAAEVLKREAYEVECEDVESTSKQSPVKNNTSITSFFKIKTDKPVLHRQHKFFTQRLLSRKVEF